MYLYLSLFLHGHHIHFQNFLCVITLKNTHAVISPRLHHSSDLAYQHFLSYKLYRNIPFNHTLISYNIHTYTANARAHFSMLISVANPFQHGNYMRPSCVIIPPLAFQVMRLLVVHPF